MINESAADDLADEINRSVADAVDVVPGLALHLLGSDELGARLLDPRSHQELRVDRDKIAARFSRRSTPSAIIASPVGILFRPMGPWRRMQRGLSHG